MRKKRTPKNLDVTGQQFHQLKVLNLHHRHVKTGELYWTCLCSCGKISVVKGSRLYGKERPTKTCGKCKTYKGIIGEYWCRLRNQAKKRNIELLITKQYIWNLIEKQDHRCALSGLPITLAKNCIEYHEHQWTASLDRINSDLGYVEGNVQWVHKDINFMKYTLTTQQLLELCLIIAKRNYNI